MSEYMQSQKKGTTDTLDNTLFDDKLLDDMADKVGSYDEARRLLGIETPLYERPEITVHHEGASVELGARALATHNIMDTYNQLNKTMGARIVSEQPGNEFNQRYRHPEEVREHMGDKASKMIHENNDDFDTLNATSDMIKAGFSQESVDQQKAQLKRDMMNRYGPGKAYAPERNKLVNKLSKTAQRSSRHL